MRADTQKVLQAVMANAELSAEQRNKAIMDIRTATEKTIQSELGAAGAKHYLKTGGYWLRSMGGQNFPTPQQ